MRDSHSPFMVHSALVSLCNELNSSRSVLLKAKMDLFQFTRQQGHGTSTEQTSEPIGYFSFGSTLRGLSFQRTVVPSLIRHGESPQNVSTTSLCKNGCHIAQNDLFIPLLQL